MLKALVSGAKLPSRHTRTVYPPTSMGTRQKFIHSLEEFLDLSNPRRGAALTLGAPGRWTKQKNFPCVDHSSLGAPRCGNSRARRSWTRTPDNLLASTSLSEKRAGVGSVRVNWVGQGQALEPSAAPSQLGFCSLLWCNALGAQTHGIQSLGSQPVLHLARPLRSLPNRPPPQVYSVLKINPGLGEHRRQL